MGALIRQVRSRLLALPGRVGGACGLDRAVIAAVDAEIRAILVEMADAATYRAYFEADDKPQKRAK